MIATNKLSLFFWVSVFLSGSVKGQIKDNGNLGKPNVILIYADDLGYGDLSCYGATKITTPNLDKLAQRGIRFTNAHTTSATCTPSRFALMTGIYPWRKSGTGILPGDAALIIPTDKITLPKVFKQAGYTTAIVGKWHLGLGDQLEKNWNGEIKPGPNEVGFDYSFIFPATADRVPTVFMENHKVIATDSKDPIEVNYQKKIGSEPTGKENPELLKLKSTPGNGHDQTIVNGIGRIGFMTGGKMARWADEEVSSTFLSVAQSFIEKNKKSPFFLFYSLTEPHVPRMPATRFKGSSNLGLRGDAILQLDWSVGEIMKQLDREGLTENTLIIFSSDNGPVLDDGYQDEAVSRLNGHTPAGILRGGKYSSLEGGTRIPFILSFPLAVKAGKSDALVSQIDLLASFASVLKVPLPANEAADSENHMAAFLGKDQKGKTMLIEQGLNEVSAVVYENWKYIAPTPGVAVRPYTNIESGNLLKPQLFNLKEDLSEQKNLAEKYPEKVKQLEEILKKALAKQ